MKTYELPPSGTNFVSQYQNYIWGPHGPQGVKNKVSTTNVRAVAQCISRHADYLTGYNSYPSIDRLCVETALTRKTVFASIAALVAQGFVIKTRGTPSDPRANMYQCVIGNAAPNPQEETNLKQCQTYTGVRLTPTCVSDLHLYQCQTCTLPIPVPTPLPTTQEKEGGNLQDQSEDEQTPPAVEVESNHGQEEPPPISDVDLGLKAEQPASEQPGGDNHLLDEFKHLTRRQPQDSDKVAKARAIFEALDAEYGVGLSDMDIEMKLPSALRNAKLMEDFGKDGLMVVFKEIGADTWTSAKKYSNGERAAKEKVVDYIVKYYGEKHRVKTESKSSSGFRTAEDALNDINWDLVGEEVER